MNKQLLFASMGVAGLVALLAILDLALKVPFGGYSLLLDIFFLVASALVLYMSWDTIRELS